MTSPFPGMDPWLLRRWGDVHTRFLTYLSDFIEPLLPPDLRVHIEQDVHLDWVGSSNLNRLRPDAHLHVGEPTAIYETEGQRDGGTAIASEPVAVPTRVIHNLPVRQRSLHIIDALDGGRLVTAIEVLSPSNKRKGFGLNAYHRKQDAMLAAGVNLLELDLIRGGGAATVAAREEVVAEHPSPWHFSLFNARSGGNTELYAIGFADRLPLIALPLRGQDEPIALSVQSVLEETKRRGRYARDFDYTGDPPGPPLPPEERARLDERLAAAGG